MIDKKAHRPAALLSASLLLLSLAVPVIGLGDAVAQQKPQGKQQAAKSETKRIGSFQGWDAYEHTDKGTKLCYLHALPEKKEPAAAKRGEIYILVTHKPNDKIRNEVSIYFGYPLKDSQPAQAVIGATAIEMFTHQEAAWAADSATDQKLVDSLRKGKTLVVKGESARGTKTTDTYNLTGFGSALQAIDKACGMGATS